MECPGSIPKFTSDQEDNNITSRLSSVSLETKILKNCDQNQEQVSTSITKNESKDGILEGEEGELDYEEDDGETLDTSANKQEIPKKAPTKEGSGVEEGELEDGEVNSDEEEGEILSDKDDDVSKKKTDKEGEEMNEDELEDGEVRDQPDSYSSNQGRGIPRKLCRYFVSGSCTWGVSCRFLHPGVNDKGAYQLLPQPGQYPVPYVRPTQPASFPAVETLQSRPALIPEYDQPEDLDTDKAPDSKPVIPEKETAWERGIRLAKENKKAARRRKEEDKEFEEKRMMLSISVDVEEEEGDKENQIKRKDLRERMKKDVDSDRGRGNGGGSRWRDGIDRYSYKDKEKKKRTRTRRSISSSPERSKYDRRRENRVSTKKITDVDRKKDKDRVPKTKPNDVDKKKDNSAPVPTTKEQDTKETKPVNKTKTSSDSENEEADKSKSKAGLLGISNDRTASDEWHDPWQRTTSPKRRSPRRRSTTSSYSSRSRSSSSSSGSSRSSRSRSRTPSSTGSESRSSSRSVSRSPSRSQSRTPSETSSRSRSATATSESDRSSTSSRDSDRKEENASKPNSVGKRSISHSQSESETPSESESESERSRSTASPVPQKPTSATRSPSGRGIRTSPEPIREREFKEKKTRANPDSREERGDKYRQQPVIGWDRREQQRWEDPYGRGSRDSRGNKERENSQRRRRTPPTRRESEQRRRFEEAVPHSHRESIDQSKPVSPPRSRDYSRRDDRSSNGTSSSTKSGNRGSNVPSNESWSAERRKRQPIPLSSGSVRYAGHKDIKLTLNKSVGKSQPSSQSSRSYSPTRQAEASSSSTGQKDNEAKKRWGRPFEPEAPQRHSSPRDDVTSSKPIKRAADSVLTPRPVDAPSNKRPSDDSSKNRMEPTRPLKRSADSAPATKRTAPENVSIKSQPRDQPEPAESKAGHMSNSSRREELLRELKAVEDAIARKRARIE